MIKTPSISSFPRHIEQATVNDAPFGVFTPFEVTVSKLFGHSLAFVDFHESEFDSRWEEISRELAGVPVDFLKRTARSVLDKIRSEENLDLWLEL